MGIHATSVSSFSSGNTSSDRLSESNDEVDQDIVVYNNPQVPFSPIASRRRPQSFLQQAILDDLYERSVIDIWKNDIDLSEDEYNQRNDLAAYLQKRATYNPDTKQWVVKGNLNIPAYNAITTFPNRFLIEGYLNLDNWQSLEILPDDLVVRGCFYLNHCVSLIELPRSITIGDDLWIEHCETLEYLPDALNIPGSLYAYGCGQLRNIPDDLYVGADADFRQCSNLQTLPEPVLSWDLTDEGRKHNIYIEDTGIPIEMINLWEAAGLLGVKLVYVPDIARVLTKWDQKLPIASSSRSTYFITADNIQSWEIRPDQLKDLTSFIQKLELTQEHKQRNSRCLLAQRLRDVLQTMHNNKILRDDFLKFMHDAITSCADRAIFFMIEMEQLVEVEKINQTDDIHKREMLLMQMARSYVMIQAIEKIAFQHIIALKAKHRNVDEIEIMLTYKTKLAKDLKLPIKTYHILFSGYHPISEQELDVARQAAIAAKNDSHVLDEYLSTWDVWQHHLRQKEIRSLVWEDFKVVYYHATMLHEITCEITHSLLADAVQPTVYVKQSENNQVKHFVDFESFCRWYIQTGQDSYRQPVDLTEITFSKIKYTHKKQKSCQ